MKDAWMELMKDRPLASVRIPELCKQGRRQPICIPQLLWPRRRLAWSVRSHWTDGTVYQGRGVIPKQILQYSSLFSPPSPVIQRGFRYKETGNPSGSAKG